MLILFLRTGIIYLFITVLMRLMGKRHLGELHPSELVSTILISNLASISIESPEIPLASSFMPMLLIVVCELFVSGICFASDKISCFISGKPVFVIKNGIIDQSALSDLRLNIHDLMAALRAKNIYDPEDVYYALMETSGSFSICCKGEKRCQNSANFCSSTAVPCIIDGQINLEWCRFCRQTPEHIEKILDLNKIRISDILLMMFDAKGSYKIIKKEGHIKQWPSCRM